MRKLLPVLMTVVAALSAGLHAQSDRRGFLGRWNMTSTGTDRPAVFWLEVTEDNGQLSGMFLNRGGSPVKLASIKVEGGELVFQTAAPQGRTGQTFRARLEGGKLTGTAAIGERTLTWEGVRPPAWPPSNANGAHTYGKPVVLVDGTSLDAWTVQNPTRPLGWTAVDGAITNEAKANNLVSKEKFKDFKIQGEYKIDKGSNSGIYLRGRYELQVLDDAGKEPEEHGHMSIYAWVKPTTNASKPAGEWQTMEAVIVGNRVTVTLNGRKIHDNATIQAITGGALDAHEDQPGPIMLQGDHGKVWYRKLVVTPIVRVGT